MLRVLPRVKLEKVENDRITKPYSPDVSNNIRKRCIENSVVENITTENKCAKISEKSNIETKPIVASPKLATLQQATSVVVPSTSNSVVSPAQICRAMPNLPKDTVVLKSPTKNPQLPVSQSAQVAPASLPIYGTRSTSVRNQQIPTPPPQPPAPKIASVPSSSSPSLNKKQLYPATHHEETESYECLYCDEAFMDKSKLRFHIVRKHCEHFFATLKDPNLSSDEFKNIVYSLFQDVEKSHVVSNGNLASSAYNCPQCHTKQDSDGDVYAHMFRFHYTDITSKLLALQKEAVKSRAGTTCSQTVSLAKNKETAKSVSFSFPCSCGMRYASKRTLEFHQTHNCKLNTQTTLQVQTSKNLASTNNPKPNLPSTSTSNYSQAPVPSFRTYSRITTTSLNKFHCAYCGKGFPSQNDHRVHLLTIHQIEELSKYVTPGVTSDQIDTTLKSILHQFRKIPGNDNAGGCVLCSEVFFEASQLQNHILLKHFDTIVCKLRGILPQNAFINNQYNSSNPAAAISIISVNNGPVVNGTIVNPGILQNHNAAVISSAPVKTDNQACSNPDTMEMEVIMQDPLCLDFLEYDADPNAVVFQEEEQLKMEWLFSFIDQEEVGDGSGIQTQAQQVTTESKGFIIENSDSEELILP